MKNEKISPGAVANGIMREMVFVLISHFPYYKFSG